MKKVLILGGLGNGSVIANAIIDANLRGYNEYKFTGYLNDRDNVNEIEGYPVLGGLKDVQKFIREDYYFINTIFKIGGQKERIKLHNSLNIPDERLATFIHPMSYIAPNVKLGQGCIVMPNVSISPATVFGKGCRVMIGATIGHNNSIGNFCFFAPNSCIGSYLQLGTAVTVSLNSCIREFVKIGNYATVAMGAVVLKDIPEGEIWAGNPAKFLKKGE